MRSATAFRLGSDFKRIFIVGGAGFIGSHFTDALLSDSEVVSVTLFDNFSSGRPWHYEHHSDDPRLRVVCGDVANLDHLTEEMAGHDIVIHLASNPDIAAAVTNPSIDFDLGTKLTHHVVEAMRQTGTERILYASGSGIYGDLGNLEAAEDHGPLKPVSTYGASKLAGEALICAYTHMFGITGRIFRFGNVVGPRQTHGVGFDFVRRLLDRPDQLTILGDGQQSKSYIHVSDVVYGVLLAGRHGQDPYATYNVATGDYITVTEIAALAIGAVGVDSRAVKLIYTGGPRGWKGDVPVVRMDTNRIRSLGWRNRYSTEEALRLSLQAMVVDARAGRLE